MIGMRVSCITSRSYPVSALYYSVVCACLCVLCACMVRAVVSCGSSPALCVLMSSRVGLHLLVDVFRSVRCRRRMSLLCLSAPRERRAVSSISAVYVH